MEKRTPPQQNEAGGVSIPKRQGEKDEEKELPLAFLNTREPTIALGHQKRYISVMIAKNLCRIIPGESSRWVSGPQQGSLNYVVWKYV